MNILIVQTAFIGDVILATAVVEKLHHVYPAAKIDFLLRKGNEDLLKNHPLIYELIVWDKKQNKLKNLNLLIKKVRKNKYEYIVNLHRFASSGLITALSGAKHKIGFDKNPFSMFYTSTVRHEIGKGKHEVTRNLELIADITDSLLCKPKLYPSSIDYKTVQAYKDKGKFICIAPASVWFTKQFPMEKWVELIELIPEEFIIYLLGAPADHFLCEEIKQRVNNKTVENLSGKLRLLESAALMTDAQMNYVNDSAPMHLASAMNAPVTAIFCSTVPDFGFGPLSDHSRIIETKEQLNCRPCGLHGYKECPEKHFKCAYGIEVKELLF